MRLVLPRTDLLRLLSATTRVVESRNTIPILAMVRIVADGGRATFTTTDLDVCVTASVSVMADAEGAVCVDATMLEGIVKKLPASADVMLAVEGKGKSKAKDGSPLTISAGKSRFTLHTLPASNFPEMTSGTFDAEFTADLAALFAPVKFAMSTEEARYYLNGIYLHHEGALKAVATDGHRLARATGSTATDFKGVIVPRKTVGLVPAGDIKVELSDTKIRLTSGDVVITSKLVDGTYPDYQRVIPDGNDKKMVVDRKALATAVDRVSTVSSERGQAVKLSLGDGVVALSVVSADAGSAADEVAVEYDAAPMEIGFNAKYLIEVLAAVPGEEVTVMLGEPGSPTLFRGKPEGLLFVCMPMRV